MPTANLTRRDGVELARVGTWPAATGPWTASTQDFASAIAATACPAVRRPYVRIGHFDGRFRGDGEPALGWVENLRLTDGGNTLVGDVVGMPGWLDGVLASAYPDRSVEGVYNRRCQLNHVHPFVLDGLALLGVTRPGVGTLKPIGGIDDVRALFDVAATAGEVHIAASIPGAAVVAAAEESTGAMIALIPTDEDAARLFVDGGEAVDQLHCTLMYLGKAAEIPTKARSLIVETVSHAINGLPRVDADGFAVSAFNPSNPDRDTCIVLGLGGEAVDDAHYVVETAMRDLAANAMLDLPAQHRPFVAHLTLAYTDDLSRVAELADRTGPVVFDRVRVVFGGDAVDIPLVAVDWGAMSVAAAADGDELKRWWTTGPGLKKWRNAKHPWTTLFRHLKKHMSVEMARRTASEWYRLVFGHMPNQKKVNASEVTVPNPQPNDVDRIKAAWNAKAPFSQHIHMVRAGAAIVLDESDRSFYRVPVTVDGDTVTFGELSRVMPDFVDYDEGLVAASVVFASREESRPGPVPDPRPPVEPAPPAGPPPDEDPQSPTPPQPGGVPVSPGAEPEEYPSEPTEGEDSVSTLSTDVRSRLGLTDDADDAAVVAALDALKTKADSPPAPDPEQVAASAAAVQENTELRKEVQVLASQVQQVTTELAATKAEKAATVKAGVLDAAQGLGKFAPAQREQWDRDYDEAPGAVTRILASIAPGTAVPVAAAGHTGTGEEVVDLDALSEAEAGSWAAMLGIDAGELAK